MPSQAPGSAVSCSPTSGGDGPAIEGGAVFTGAVASATIPVGGENDGAEPPPALEATTATRTAFPTSSWTRTYTGSVPPGMAAHMPHPGRSTAATGRRTRSDRSASFPGSRSAAGPRPPRPRSAAAGRRSGRAAPAQSGDAARERRRDDEDGENADGPPDARSPRASQPSCMPVHVLYPFRSHGRVRAADPVAGPARLVSAAPPIRSLRCVQGALPWTAARRG